MITLAVNSFLLWKLIGLLILGFPVVGKPVFIMSLAYL